MSKGAATDAVSELVRPHKMIVNVTPSVRYAVRAPCLLRQLADCVMTGSERGGRGVPGSRAPANADALDLWYEITHNTHMWAKELDFPRRDPGGAHPIPWVGRLLRTVAASAEADMARAVERSALDWTRRIRTMVTGTPEQRGVRGAQCPGCGEARVVEELDGERVVVPAVVLVVREVGGKPLRWLACRACPWTMTLGVELEGSMA